MGSELLFVQTNILSVAEEDIVYNSSIHLRFAAMIFCDPNSARAVVSLDINSFSTLSMNVII